MSDQGRLSYAIREWNKQTGQSGSLDTFGLFVCWLEENYGVRWDGGFGKNNIKITNPELYTFFLLKWP